MAKKLSARKRLILEAALKTMLDGCYEDTDITGVSQYAGMDPEKIRRVYPTDESLRLSAMKYAADVWVEQVKADLARQQTKKEKLYALIRHFIAGSESHPQSLSLYVDIWKKLRDGKEAGTRLLRSEMSGIYRLYVSLFEEALKEIYENKAAEDTEQLAWIMVAISDGFHVQSLIQPKQLDFDRIARTFCGMIERD